MYKITLNDDTQLDNLELNGNNFIAPNEIPNSVFENTPKTVKIYDKETQTEEILTDAVLISNRVHNGKSWFILGEKTEQEKREEETNTSLTDIQLALVELYEMIIGG